MTDDVTTPFSPDESATWIYWTIYDTKERGIGNDWVWERLRNRRNQLLTETDWRMVADAPWDTEVWAEYRQALRDLPDNTSDPREAEWPESP